RIRVIQRINERAPLEQERSIKVERLDPVVPGISDEDPVAGDGDATSSTNTSGEAPELARVGPRRTELAQELPFRTEHLHPLVAGINDIDTAIVCRCNAARSVELATLGAGARHLVQVERT